MNIAEQVQFDRSLVDGLTSKAARIGIREAGYVIERKVKTNLNRQGTPTARGGDAGWDNLAYGRRLLAKVAGDPYQRTLARMRSVRARRSIDLAESIEKLGGLVDPPGGMPRSRTGTLKRSIRTIGGPTPLEVLIGSNLRYAAAQEWGANLPGGQPFLIINGKFVPLKKGRRGMGLTKPSRLPARPYLRPSLESARSEAFARFVSVASDVIAGKWGTTP